MENMQKVSHAYKASKTIYDDTLTQKKLWAKLYISFFWGGVDDIKIAEKVLDMIPKKFSGNLLDVPVGTGVFTANKYKSLLDASITCLDYSKDMLIQAKERFSKQGLDNIQCIQGDVGNLSFKDNSFDIVLSMNGFHAFPNKDRAFEETARVLKAGGIFCGCFYIRGESKRRDFIVNSFLAKKGWFTPPFYNLNELFEILKKYYSKIEISNEKAMVYFKCIK